MDKNVKTALIIGGVIIAIIVVLPLVLGSAFGQQGYGYGMMGGYGAMFIMPVLWIAVIGLIVWAVAASVRGPSESRSHDSSGTDSALELLKRRYARGEINKEEFEEKKKDLA